ncbi:hypothetical protein SCA6_018548 [Theobroma cacao]
MDGDTSFCVISKTSAQSKCIFYAECQAYVDYYFREAEDNKENDQENQGQDKDVELPIFELATVARATDSFSMDNKLGEAFDDVLLWLCGTRICYLWTVFSKIICLEL